MSSKNKPKIKVFDFIDNGIYPGWTLFCVGYTYAEIHAKLMEKNYTDYACGIEQYIGVELKYIARLETVEDNKTKEERKLFYLLLNDFDFSDLDYCVLAHEIVHLCQFFLKSIGINRDNEIESEAYYHSHLMMQCLKILRDNVR